MTPERIGTVALGLAALGFLLLASLACLRLLAARRSARMLVQALANHGVQSTSPTAFAAAGVGTVGEAAAGSRDVAGASGGTGAARGSGAGGHAQSAAQSPRVGRPAPRTGLAGLFDPLAETGVRWLDSPVGRLFVAEEDRRVLEQCGYVDMRSRGVFLMARMGCGIVFALGVAGATGTGSGAFRQIVFGLAGLLAGFMIPKIYLRRRAINRRESVADELPMFVDLLRLLQGVGLSLDQSIQVLINEFRHVLPVLSGEMEIAQRQFVAGRTREQSLQRVATIYESEDLHAVIRLLVQVDRHGGAVQEPLKHFGDRLRDVRRATLRERIGKVTVKMTGVMVITLLPALLIATAGPGVIAVIRSFASIHH